MLMYEKNYFILREKSGNCYIKLPVLHFIINFCYSYMFVSSDK